MTRLETPSRKIRVRVEFVKRYAMHKGILFAVREYIGKASCKQSFEYAGLASKKKYVLVERLMEK